MIKTPDRELPESPSRRRFLRAAPSILAVGFAALNPDLRTALALSEQATDGSEDHAPISFINASLNPVAEQWQPYPGRPWKRAIVMMSGPEGESGPWEKVAAVTPDNPVAFNHESPTGNWSMTSLLKGQLYEPEGDSYLFFQFQVNTPPTGNTGIFIHNGEPYREGTDHRRLHVGLRGRDLVVAYWDGNRSQNYNFISPTQHQFDQNEDGSVLTRFGIAVNSEGRQPRVLLPDGRVTEPFDLGETSLFDPSGKKRMDVAVVTAAGVTNTVQTVMMLRRLQPPDVAA